MGESGKLGRRLWDKLVPGNQSEFECQEAFADPGLVVVETQCLST